MRRWRQWLQCFKNCRHWNITIGLRSFNCSAFHKQNPRYLLCNRAVERRPFCFDNLFPNFQIYGALRYDLVHDSRTSLLSGIKLKRFRIPMGRFSNCNASCVCNGCHLPIRNPYKASSWRILNGNTNYCLCGWIHFNTARSTTSSILRPEK